MPNFLIVGAMRSGTTSLARWLGSHPSVYVAPVKEVHFFDRNYQRGFSWYEQHFVQAKGEPAIGEATPNYLYSEVALGRIAADLRDVKVLILLRNPVDRAYSHYHHRRARGGETLSFEAAIEAEPERLAHGTVETREHFSYVDRGRYLGQIRRVFGHFPRDSVLIQLFEELCEDPRTTFSTVAEFLDIDASLVPDVVGRQLNRYQEFRSTRVRQLSRHLPVPLGRVVGRLNKVAPEGYEPMSNEVRGRLDAVFAAERDELARLTGLDLDRWSP